jgi:hypothetical protein
MQINDKDIIRAAQELRDEDNQQLHISPWRRHHHFQFPAWLAAIPAAVIAGFFLGIWTHHHKQDETPLTALVDTVYITVKEPSPDPDTISAIVHKSLQPSPKHVRSANQSKRRLGCPIKNDNIRYDLLVQK